MSSRAIIDDFAFKLAEIRRESEMAIRQLDATQIRRSLDGDTNSVAVTMKHVGGNLRSRFTNFLTEDGEKPWRERDDEFVDSFPRGKAGVAAVMETWSAGWAVLEATLATLKDADLKRTVTIRGAPHSVARALARAVAHLAYHQGQITLISRILVGPSRWKTITMPRRGAAAKLLSGGNPQISKGAGDEPVQAYIRAMPGWKRDVGLRMDAIITRTVPEVKKAVKWNSPLYGVEGKGWFLGVHCFAKYVKVAFFKGAELKPPPPVASKDAATRYLHVAETGAFDEKQFADWVRQASRRPGWGRC